MPQKSNHVAAFLWSSNPKEKENKQSESSFWKENFPHRKKFVSEFVQCLFKLAVHINWKTRSRAVSTERTILSPFTKEYRVLAAHSGIRLFLEGLPSGGSLQYQVPIFKSTRNIV